mgnify:CR=1 FL=1
MHPSPNKKIRARLTRRFVCSLLLLAASANALSQDSVEPDGAGLHDVFLYLKTSQEGLLGPDAMAAEPGDADFFDFLMIRTAVNEWETQRGLNDVQRLAAGLQKALGPFHFETATLNILAAVENNSDWVTWDTADADSIAVLHGLARQAFDATPVDHVLGVDARYFVSPGLDQLRAIVRVRLVPRPAGVGRPRVLFTRDYEYLSPSVGQVLRPFHDGEKEALATEVEDHYRMLISESPEKEHTYQKDMSRDLKKLAKRDIIPPDYAIAQGWPDQSMARALRQAQRHIQYMLSMDLSKLRSPEPENGERVRFDALTESGKPDTKSGYVVDTLDGNTIYRDRKRNMYSVP